ncbi:uncharacterized protein PG998_005983 [Apiospora kogelbergensis]|uniref:uncharacterized protein n=1 Tax=Apiospora kogelbergensis TaxID=1337665 RepID=UPI003130C7F0
MFGGGSSSKSDSAAETPKTGKKSPSPDRRNDSTSPVSIKSSDQAASGEKRSGNGSPSGRQGEVEKKRRSSGVGSKASSLIASAKNSLNFSQVGRSNSDMNTQTALQKLGKQDPALAVPQGQHNNSAGESLPGPRSTFRVGVWEDRNKKCRRTMEDTHAFLYNFLHTPAPVIATEADAKSSKSHEASEDGEAPSESIASQDMVETDNGYFAIFDGHAGTFAADWCGKKLHILLEDIIKRNPNVPIPELLDQTFTSVDNQLEKLPLKNSGCTAAVAVLRWEDRPPKATDASKSKDGKSEDNDTSNAIPESAHAKLKPTAARQRVLYTANVGDARIILCRNGKALRLSYDHKGSDENEGKRIANAGGLILNNRVNGVLAVTRALGDTYMKDLVTGHPYTTETVIQAEMDEFIIIACDGLWDVCSDQEAVDLIRESSDPSAAAKQLVDHALARFSTDNLSCMVVRFDKAALLENQKDKTLGVEGDPNAPTGKVSESEKILSSTKQQIADGGNPAIGVSASNSGRGHDPIPVINDNPDGFTPTTLDSAVEEEVANPDSSDAPEVAKPPSEPADPLPELHLPDEAKEKIKASS